MQLDRGVFTISLDFELIWGTLDKPKWKRFQPLCMVEREEVFERLLELFTEFEVSASWCVVGHLFLDHCVEANGCKHPRIFRPSNSPGARDWFHHDPCLRERDAPLFYGKTLVEKIRDCRVNQEIGSHTFSHVLMGDAGCSEATAESEVAECVRVAEEMGISLRSMAFPRNSVGHLGTLHRHGFTTYRGTGLSWHEQERHHRLLRRAGHLWDILTAAAPPVTDAVKTSSGLWNVAGSMLYTPSFGLRRFVPVSLRVRRARKGLRRAVDSKRVFHLWMHPTDLVVRRKAMLGGLREILAEAAELRAGGKLDILPMSAIAREEASPAALGRSAFARQPAWQPALSEVAPVSK